MVISDKLKSPLSHTTIDRAKFQSASLIVCPARDKRTNKFLTLEAKWLKLSTPSPSFSSLPELDNTSVLFFFVQFHLFPGRPKSLQPWGISSMPSMIFFRCSFCTGVISNSSWTLEFYHLILRCTVLLAYLYFQRDLFLCNLFIPSYFIFKVLVLLY